MGQGQVHLFALSIWHKEDARIQLHWLDLASWGATMWMHLENIVLSKINQTQNNNYGIIPLT